MRTSTSSSEGEGEARRRSGVRRRRRAAAGGFLLGLELEALPRVLAATGEGAQTDFAPNAFMAVALTLGAVGGLTTAEIANAFLVPEAMAQRAPTRTARSSRCLSVLTQIQAAIAAIHDEAARFEETDWRQILAF